MGNIFINGREVDINKILKEAKLMMLQKTTRRLVGSLWSPTFECPT